MLTGKGIPMAKGISFHKTKSRTEILEAISTLQFPVFVKPNKNGSSYGVSKVAEMSLLSEAIEKAFEFDDEIIVEEFIKGRELTCGVFEGKNGYTALPATEIISKNEFFDYKAKYLGESKEVTPAEISETEMMEPISGACWSRWMFAKSESATSVRGLNPRLFWGPKKTGGRGLLKLQYARFPSGRSLVDTHLGRFRINT